MAYLDYCYMTISEAVDKVSSREISPTELIEAHLERIQNTDAKLNSFITLLADDALNSASRVEQRIRDGLAGTLAGIPIGLKDLYYTRGIRTTVGSKILRGMVPTYDAAVTERFTRADAIVLGKLQMHEFALGGTSENPHDGPARNPWNVECVTGGSSGGSGSAVASGQVMGALGSDTGGSIRIPASLCGIVGLKPTFGRVSRHGVYPLAWSLDTVGPMTRTVRDAAMIMNVIAGYDSRDPSSADVPDEDFTRFLGSGVEGMRIGLPQEYFYDVIDAEVKSLFENAALHFESMGARVDRVSIPALADSIPISSTLLLTEAAEVHLEYLRTRPGDFGEDVLARLQQGAMTPAVTYIKAQRARRAYNRQVAEVMKSYDLLVAPTSAVTAPRISETTVNVAGSLESKLSILPRLTRPFNLTGMPTASVVCGFASNGMPVGMQIAGRLFEDARVLQAAHAYEQSTNWHIQRPPI